MEPYNPYAPQGQVQVVVRQGNGLAVAGMVLGILAVVFCWLWFIAGILGILGIIFGAIGISRANRVGTGKGMAITGIVCGVLGMVLAVVIIFVFVRAVTGYIDKELESSKAAIVKLQVDKVATDWYNRWQLKTNEACPKDLMEVARAVGANDTKDAWGTELQFHCGSEAGLPNGLTFGVYSVGEDLKEGTSDDIKSWERRQQR